MRSDSGIFPSKQATVGRVADDTKRRAQSIAVSVAAHLADTWAPFASPLPVEFEHRIWSADVKHDAFSFPASIMIGPVDPDELPF